MTAAAVDEQAVGALLGLATQQLAARALHVVAEVGVADALDEEPSSTDALAASTDTDPDALARVLRLLADHGIFTREGSDRWRHTPASRLLRGDHVMSQRAYVRMLGGELMWASVSALEHTLRTGVTASRAIAPGGFFAHLQAHPEQRAVFDEAMAVKARTEAGAVLAAYDFSRHRRIADIGGGRGELVTAVLRAAPTSSAVLFDLPHVIADARTDEIPRLEVVAGDFFTDPLPACDAYMLAQVVHDWQDARAAVILRAVVAAAPRDATVLLVEWVLPEDSGPHPASGLDVMMLATTGDRERTVSGYRDLLEAAGIELIDVHPTPGAVSVLEGRVRG